MRMYNYGTKFSVLEYQYHDTSHGKYEREHRLSDGKLNLSVWNDKIINEMRELLDSDKPLTEMEEIAYDEMKDTLSWIDEMNEKYEKKEDSIEFVFETEHDY
jgi:hypothetical protein